VFCCAISIVTLLLIFARVPRPRTVGDAFPARAWGGRLFRKLRA
jgi:hypothetical protein